MTDSSLSLGSERISTLDTAFEILQQAWEGFDFLYHWKIDFRDGHQGSSNGDPLSANTLWRDLDGS